MLALGSEGSPSARIQNLSMVRMTPSFSKSAKQCLVSMTSLCLSYTSKAAATLSHSLIFTTSRLLSFRLCWLGNRNSSEVAKLERTMYHRPSPEQHRTALASHNAVLLCKHFLLVVVVCLSASCVARCNPRTLRLSGRARACSSAGDITAPLAVLRGGVATGQGSPHVAPLCLEEPGSTDTCWQGRTGHHHVTLHSTSPDLSNCVHFHACSRAAVFPASRALFT
ncbi:hypothetical protein E2C01_020124 [Portunus trituberculatus]|uniref:Uncharacterized protein n=1 Tax=Portunus trituberculatus TaxID=210409 RepID=A0A5B7E189_PORTR|nr:hypothetical protein [Portunus trituberculatus]